jgi:hypothetical protein
MGESSIEPNVATGKQDGVRVVVVRPCGNTRCAENANQQGRGGNHRRKRAFSNSSTQPLNNATD